MRIKTDKMLAKPTRKAVKKLLVAVLTLVLVLTNFTYNGNTSSGSFIYASEVDGENDPSATPTATPDEGDNDDDPTATPTATPGDDDPNATATPTATATPGAEGPTLGVGASAERFVEGAWKFYNKDGDVVPINHHEGFADVSVPLMDLVTGKTPSAHHETAAIRVVLKNVTDSDPILTGGEITYTCGFDSSTLYHSYFTDIYVAVTIPEEVDLDTVRVSSSSGVQTGLDYKIGYFANGASQIKAVLINVGTTYSGMSNGFTLSYSFPPEITPAKAYESQAFIIGSIYSGTAADPQPIEGEDKPYYNFSAAGGNLATDNDIKVSKEASGDPESVYFPGDDSYGYSITYDIDVTRINSAGNGLVGDADGSLHIKTLTLKDTVIGPDNKPAYDVTVNNLAADKWSYNTATGLLTVDLTGGDFHYAAGEPYHLENKVSYTVTFDEAAFAAVTDKVTIQNIIYASATFDGDSKTYEDSDSENVEITVISNREPKFAIGKKAVTTPVTWDDPYEPKEVNYNLSMQNTGDLIIDGILEDSVTNLKDGETPIDGAFITGLTIPAFGTACASVEVWVKTAIDQAEYVQYGSTYTAAANITGVSWTAVKIVAKDMAISSAAKELLFGMTVKLPGQPGAMYITPLNTEAVTGFDPTTVMHSATNTVSGSYTVKRGGSTEPVSVGDDSDTVELKYKDIGTESLTKAKNEDKIPNLTDFGKIEGHEVKFTINYTNNTGAVLSEVVITDSGLEFFNGTDTTPLSGVTYVITGVTINGVTNGIQADILTGGVKTGFTYTMTNVPVDATCKIVVTAIVKSNGVTFSKITNHVKSESVYKYGYTRTINKSADITVNTANHLKITKEVIPVTVPLLEGDADKGFTGLYVSDQYLIYEITVTNDGQGPVTGFSIFEKHSDLVATLKGVIADNTDNVNFMFKGIYGPGTTRPTVSADGTVSGQSPITNDPAKYITAEHLYYHTTNTTLNVGDKYTIWAVVKLNKITNYDVGATYDKVKNTANLIYEGGTDKDSAETTLKGTSTSAELKKGYSGSDNEELYLMTRSEFYIDAFITTDVTLKTLTITDTGIKFNNVPGSAVGPILEYAWISGIQLPKEWGALFDDGVKTITVQYTTDLNAAADDSSWTDVKVFNNKTAFANDVTVTPADVVPAGIVTKFAQVRVIFEPMPALTNAGVAVKRILSGGGQGEGRIKIFAGFNNLLELVTSLPEGQVLKMENDARMDWTFYYGPGDGVGNSYTNGGVITVPSVNPALTLEKSVNPPGDINYDNLIKGSVDETTNKPLHYTLNFLNGVQSGAVISGATVDRAVIEDFGLKFNDVYDPDIYDIKNIVVNITNGDYKGPVRLYYSSNNNPIDTATSTDYIELAYADRTDGKYVFDTTGKTVKSFAVVIGDADNKVPKGLKAVVDFDAYLKAQTNGFVYVDNIELIRNDAKATIYLGSKKFEKLAHADNTIVYIPKGTVLKQVSKTLTGTYYPRKSLTDPSQDGVSLPLSGILGSTGESLFYEITATNNTTYGLSRLMLTDTTLFDGSGITNPMKLVRLYVPTAFAGAVTVENQPVTSSGTYEIGTDTYNVYTVAEGANFILNLINVPREISVKVYAEYLVKADYTSDLELYSVTNKVWLDVYDRIGTHKNGNLSIVQVPVTNEDIPFINMKLSKGVSPNKVFLSQLLTGPLDLTYTIGNIGHGSNSNGDLYDFLLEDFGLVLTPEGGAAWSAEETAKYAKITSINFPAYDKPTAVYGDLWIEYGLIDKVAGAIHQDVAIWDAQNGTTLHSNDLDQILTFKVYYQGMPMLFDEGDPRHDPLPLSYRTALNGVKITVNATLAKIVPGGNNPYDKLAENVEVPEIGAQEEPIFKVTNFVKQTATHPTTGNMERTAEAKTEVVAKGGPAFNLEKTANPGEVDRNGLYLNGASIHYVINGIKNESEYVLDTLILTDSGPTFDTAGYVPGYGITEMTVNRFNLDPPAPETDETDFTITVVFDNGDRHVVPTGNFEIGSIATISPLNGAEYLGKSFVIEMTNVPVGFAMDVSYDLKVEAPDTYAHAEEIESFTNKVSLKYTVNGKTGNGKDDEVTVYVKDSFQPVEIYKFGGPEQVYEKSTVTWDIYVRNGKAGTTGKPSVVVNPVVTDLLPVVFTDYSKVEVTKIEYGHGIDPETFYTDAAVAARFSINNENDYKAYDAATGRTRCTVSFQGHLMYDEVIHIQITAVVKSEAGPGSIKNTAEVHTDNTDGEEDSARVYIIFAGNDILTKESSGSLNVFKDENGAPIPDPINPEVSLRQYFSYPNPGTSNYDDPACYRISFSNFVNDITEGIAIGDVLPYEGDVTIGKKDDRNSGWSPTLRDINDFRAYWMDTEENGAAEYDAEATTALQGSITIYISTNDYLPAGAYVDDFQAAILELNKTGNLTRDGWINMKDATPAQIAASKAFIVYIGKNFNLAEGMKITFNVDVQTPAFVKGVHDAPTDPEFIAWNEVSYVNRFTEKVTWPNMVALNLVASELGDFVWVEPTNTGIQQGEADTPKPGVTVLLFNLKDLPRNDEMTFDQIVDFAVAHGYAQSAVTDEYGRYNFTGLREGGYLIAFVKPQGYAFSLYKNTENAEIDSDANHAYQRSLVVQGLGRVTAYFTEYIYLGENAVDPTWDAGLYKIFRNITFTKVDAVTSAGLAGAEFRLTGTDVDGIAFEQTVISGPGGVVTFTNVPWGTYTLTETAPPTGYAPNPNVYYVVCDDNGIRLTNAAYETIETIGNVPFGWSILVQKDLNTTETDRSGFAFTLSYLNDAGQPVEVATQHTNAAGQTLFAGLDLTRTYLISEIVIPDRDNGYYGDPVVTSFNGQAVGNVPLDEFMANGFTFNPALADADGAVAMSIFVRNTWIPETDKTFWNLVIYKSIDVFNADLANFTFRLVAYNRATGAEVWREEATTDSTGRAVFTRAKQVDLELYYRLYETGYGARPNTDGVFGTPQIVRFVGDTYAYIAPSQALPIFLNGTADWRIEFAEDTPLDEFRDLNLEIYVENPWETTPPVTTPPETTPPETTPPETTPPETTPPETTPPETTPPETTPPETTPPETTPPVTTPPETTPPETNPPETNPPETNPPETNPPETNPPETNPPTVDIPTPTDPLSTLELQPDGTYIEFGPNGEPLGTWTETPDGWVFTPFAPLDNFDMPKTGELSVTATLVMASVLLICLGLFMQLSKRRKVTNK